MKIGLIIFLIIGLSSLFFLFFKQNHESLKSADTAQNLFHFSNHNFINKLCLTTSSVFAGGNGKLWKYNRKTSELEKEYAVPGMVSGISVLSDEVIFLGIGASEQSGLYKISQEKLQKIFIPQIKQPDITDLVIDENNKLWIGTHSQGLFSLSGEVFCEEYPESLKKIFVTDLFAIKNQIWIATKPKTGIFRIYQNNIVHLNENSSGLKNDAVNTIFIDEKKLWVGTWSGAYSILLEEDWNDHRNWKEYSAFNQRLIVNHVRKIGKDHLGNIWFATPSGMSVSQKGGKQWVSIGSNMIKKIKYRQGDFVKIQVETIPFDGFNSDSITDVLFDHENQSVWIASERGLMKTQEKGRNQAWF